MKVENITDLTGRIAVVIGGHPGWARHRHRLGALRRHVVPAGRCEQLLEEVCAEIVACGREPVLQTADVLQRESIDPLRCAAVKVLIKRIFWSTPPVARRTGQPARLMKPSGRRSMDDKFDWDAARLPIVLRTAARQRARAHRQHRIARFLSRVLRSCGLRRVEGGRARLDQKSGRGVGARPDQRQRGCAGRVSDGTQCGLT